MDNKNFVIGIDFGTDSVRSIIVDASNGRKISDSEHSYTRWAKGMYCDPLSSQFRQHPLDYIEGLEHTVKKIVSSVPDEVVKNIAGISVGTTGSTPVAVDKAGTPLALKPGFENNPNAMFILWKDHTALKEAEEINTLAHNGHFEDFTKYVGGIYSSEWFFAKILHTLRKDKDVRDKAFSWVEQCDWIPAMLTGESDPLTIKRSRCAAGHKAMWHKEFGGLPSDEFMSTLDPLLKGLRSRLYNKTYTIDEKAGTISREWSRRLGLPGSVVVGVGAIDAHIGAIGAGIEPYYLNKVMGTSTCDMMVQSFNEAGNKLIRGICGQVDGSIIPGMLGIEAGQSAFGDIYAWFKKVLMWPLNNILADSKLLDPATKEKVTKELSSSIIKKLTEEAEKIPVEESSIVALDWMNGRRTPDANQKLKGAITGLDVSTDAPRIFRALVEATAFGSKAIVDRFTEEGIRIDGVIALGGVAKKSPFVMQTVADILNMPIKVARSEQACALGAAMAASVVAGYYPTIEDARKFMSSGFETEYQPISANTDKYAKLYKQYKILGKFIELGS